MGRTPVYLDHADQQAHYRERRRQEAALWQRSHWILNNPSPRFIVDMIDRLMLKTIDPVERGHLRVARGRVAKVGGMG